MHFNFNPSELARAGVQVREDHPNDWRFPEHPYRIKSRARYGTYHYKSAQSARLILLAHRANK